MHDPFNSADSSIGTRQLMAELNYLYKCDEKRHAYVARTALESGAVIEDNRPFLIILQSENDQATGQYFPIGTGLYNTINLRFHWDKVSVPDRHRHKVSEQEFYTRTPGNNPYLVKLSRAGLLGCQRILFGVTADCGATTLLPCWALFSACISRWRADASRCLLSALAFQRVRICKS